MPEQQQIQSLKEKILHLSAEKFEALRAIELAAGLGNFGTSLNKLDDPVPILQETSAKIRSLIKMKAFCFYLVDENSSDFVPVLYQPQEHFSLIDDEVERLIEENTFAWCLGRNKPHVTTSIAGNETLIIQALSTISRIRGIFVGVLGQERFTISDSSISLFTISLHACAHMLESYELYAWNRRTFLELEQKLETHKAETKQLAQQQEVIQHQLHATQMELDQTRRHLKQEQTRLHEMECTVRKCNRRDRTLFKLTQQLAASQSLDTSALLITQAAITLTGSSHGFACWFDPDSQFFRFPELTQATMSHFSIQNLESLKSHTLPGGWGNTVLSGKSFCSNKPVEEFPLLQGVKKTLGPKRILSVPVLDCSIKQHTLLGLITISNAAQPYGSSDVLAVERVASLFALSIKQLDWTAAPHNAR